MLLWLLSGETGITVESSCYMPDIEKTNMSKETNAYVKDYTFHVFSLFLDVIDDLLLRLHFTSVRTKNYPQGLGMF